ncbi:MAG: NAD-dependent epimerase/dehydratase family protein, partial [Thermoplasmata archaeon]|nr:NAD-dependent epimerase/dehydratase family protein [Thermoplasmata archaeon]
THGVAYDFIQRLVKDPTELKIFGDGTQSKPYVHIEDILKAFSLMEKSQTERFDVFNVGTQDHLTVHEIADIVCEKMRLSNVNYAFTGGSRGWKADVPIYRLNTDKIRARGWRDTYNSREAVVAAVNAMLENVQHGNLS